MSTKYFLIAGKGDVRDIGFKRHSLHRPSDGSYAYHVVVGDEKWGWVTRYDSMPWSGWCAFSLHWINQRDDAIEKLPQEDRLAAYKAHQEEEFAYSRGDVQTSATSLESMHGFRSRWAAATYIIKTYGYWKNS